MNPIRIGVIGLGQRIAHVLRAMQDVGWEFTLAGYVDPASVGLPIPKDRDVEAVDAGDPIFAERPILRT